MGIEHHCQYQDGVIRRKIETVGRDQKHITLSRERSRVKNQSTGERREGGKVGTSMAAEEKREIGAQRGHGCHMVRKAPGAASEPSGSKQLLLVCQ